MQVGKGNTKIDGVVLSGGLEGVGLEDGVLPLSQPLLQTKYSASRMWSLGGRTMERTLEEVSLGLV